MKVLYFISALFALTRISFAGPDKERPNIILIFVDDMGYGDPGCYGGKLAPTPNIDKLAKEGVRFTDGYAAAATCAPSRLGLMTGKYQQRLGGFSNTTCRTVIIPDDYLLMPQMLKKAGYRTAHIGKWHINHPVGSVFDEVFYPIGGAADFFPGPDGNISGSLNTPMWHGWGREKGIPYITDVLADVATEYIKAQSDHNQPFFLFLSFNAPHSPWQAPLEFKEKFKHVSHDVMQLYAGMVYSLDQNVGKVLSQLKKSGIHHNTMVLFVSDNGPEWGRDYAAFNWPKHWEDIIVGSAGPLSGRKAQFLEGGIRVPFIIRWPAVIEANTIYSRPVSTLDLYETFRVAANGPEYNTDGVDLIPYLIKKKKEDPHKALFWMGGASNPIYARMGDWKISVPLDGKSPSLFNLSTDVAEKHDIATQHPAIVNEMLVLVREWQKVINLTDGK